MNRTKIRKETIDLCAKNIRGDEVLSCDECACNERECLECLWFTLTGHFMESEE